MLCFKQITRRAILALVLAIGVTGCVGGGGGGTSGPSEATLVEVAITPTSASVAMGQNTFFTATARYSDGSSVDVTSQANWRSADARIATIDAATGVATGLVEGRIAISASFNGMTSVEAPLTVTAAVVTAIAVSASSAAVPKGVAVTFTATATYSDGSSGDVSGSVAWHSTDITVATPNGSGIAATLGLGTTDIDASMNGIASNTVTLTVTAPELVAIALNPTAATVVEGLTSNFTAVGAYTDGSTANLTTQVAWQSADGAIATIGANSGVANGVAAGSTTLNATLGGIASPNATLTVTTATVTAIAITPTAPSVAKGRTVIFTATATYNNGTSGDVSGSVVWSSSNPAVATLDATGIASTLGEGGSVIGASGYGITSNSAALTVTAPELVSLAITPTSATVMANSTQQFVASGTLTDGAVVTPSGLTWSSSDAAVASIDGNGLATTRTIGSTNISASSGGVTSNTAALAVTSAAPLGLIAVSTNKTNVTLTWSPVANATSYNLYWNLAPGVTTGSAKIVGVAPGYIHKVTNSNKTYYYRIGAVNALAETLSDEVFCYVANTAPTYTFTPGPLMSVARSGHTATLLPDGKVLVAGGATPTAELYDPVANIFAAVGSMAASRQNHTATLLANGKVLVTGGNNVGLAVASAELFDPATNTFTAVGSMSTQRQYHTATLLTNGKVLVTGGRSKTGNLGSAELFDPATNTFAATGSMSTQRQGHTATLMPSGQVLIAGGYSSTVYHTSAELFDPATNTFSLVAGAMSKAHQNHTATLLPSGQVLMARGHWDSTNISRVTDLFDPATHTFTSPGLMITASQNHTATLLPNGLVMSAGGYNGNTTYRTAELYDPVANTFTAVGLMGSARRDHTATLLHNGQVLVVGGYNGVGNLASTELFQ